MLVSEREEAWAGWSVESAWHSSRRDPVRPPGGGGEWAGPGVTEEAWASPSLVGTPSVEGRDLRAGRGGERGPIPGRAHGGVGPVVGYCQTCPLDLASGRSSVTLGSYLDIRVAPVFLAVAEGKLAHLCT